jgi:hypothetical protein
LEATVELEQPHGFGIDEARERVRALADYLHNRHGMSVEWRDADTVAVRGKYTVVAIDTLVHVEPGRVRVSGKDPGMLLRATAKKYVAGKLERYLDAGESLASLPRA